MDNSFSKMGLTLSGLYLLVCLSIAYILFFDQAVAGEMLAFLATMPLSLFAWFITDAFRGSGPASQSIALKLMPYAVVVCAIINLFIIYYIGKIIGSFFSKSKATIPPSQLINK